MKTKNIIITIGIITITTIAGCQQKNEKVMPYPFNTASIEYKIEGDVEGTMTVKIDKDYYANRINAKNKQTKEEIKLLKLDLKDYSYNIDLKQQKGQKSHNQIYNELKKLKTNQEKIDKITKFAIGETNDKKTPQPSGEKTIQGKKCNLYKISNINTSGEICIWNGIPLYSNITINGSQRKIEATKIETGIKIDSSTFKLPKDIKISESTKNQE